MASIFESGDESEAGGEDFEAGWQDKLNPSTGRTTKCDTKAPWYLRAIHWIASKLGKKYGGSTVAALAEKGYEAITSATGAMSDKELGKWLNDAGSREVYYWAVAHAREFVQRAYTATEKGWPAHKAALAELGVTPQGFAGEAEAQGDQAFKALLYAYTFGGIKKCMARHGLEAVISERWEKQPLFFLPTIEERKKKKPKDKSRRGAWIKETLQLLETMKATAPAADQLPVPSTPPATAPEATAGVALPDLIEAGTWVFAPGEGRWGYIERYAPFRDGRGRALGLRFEDGSFAAVPEQDIVAVHKGGPR